MQETFAKIDGFINNKIYDFANADELKEIHDCIFSMRTEWIKRSTHNSDIMFYTLGAATYLDGGGDQYQKHCAQSAPAMFRNFEDLYIKICNWMTELTGYESMMSEDLNPPGFHILQGSPAVPPSIKTGGNIHLDLPHERHNFSREILGVLSFTLPIRLPKLGGGCYYWTTLPKDFIHGSAVPNNLYDWFDQHKSFLPYQIGKMVFHNGQIYHQLANSHQLDSDDWRITLQGHGVLLDNNKICLYF
ncbi:MAG: hypothetical protein QM528_07565 [Phycisphaerales bacterium]|nr:hypothetical protein [Phycisphaerales bacterium]